MYHLHVWSPFFCENNAFINQCRVSRASTLKGTQLYILFLYIRKLFCMKLEI